MIDLKILLTTKEISSENIDVLSYMDVAAVNAKKLNIGAAMGNFKKLRSAFKKEVSD